MSTHDGDSAPAPAATSRRAIWGWALYDWADSAFATTVMAGFFPIFFKEYWNAGVDATISTARLGITNASASLIVALAAPLLGAMADHCQAKRRLLFGCAAMGVGATAALAAIGQGQWLTAAVVFALANVGWASAHIGYDALLQDVAPPNRVDWVSGAGYSLGYLGGGTLFLVNVVMTQHPEWFGLADTATAVRASFVSVAFWWGGFSIFTWLWVPESSQHRRPMAGAVGAALRRLADTLGRIRNLQQVALFLVAYWCYIDGVHTIIRMAVDYGLSLGFSSGDLITALLLVQFIGFPAALVFGYLGQRWGARRSILAALVVYSAITIWATQMSTLTEFYLLAVAIALVQGGVQALSRSFYTRLAPRSRTTEFFAFYNMLGKFAVIIGPILMAGVGLAARRWWVPAADPAIMEQTAARWGLGSIILLFAVGMLLLTRVDVSKAQADRDQIDAAADNHG